MKLEEIEKVINKCLGEDCMSEVKDIALALYNAQEEESRKERDECYRKGR